MFTPADVMARSCDSCAIVAPDARHSLFSVAAVAPLRKHVVASTPKMSLYQISALRIIASIKAHPSLYNRDDPQYHVPKHHKDKIWRLVCKEVCNDWEQLSATQKLEFEQVLHRRWKNLRTCFARELAVQKRERKKMKEGNVNDDRWSRKRKKYEYFEAMTFLLNPTDLDGIDLTDENAEDVSYVLADEESNDPLDREMKNEASSVTSLEMIKCAEINQTGDMTDTYQTIATETSQNENRGRNRLEDRLLDLLVEKKMEEKDEDRQFMLSLVSSFKQIDESKKLRAKIEILDVIRRLQSSEETF
ncbi:hypothetical protein ACJJTC_012094 [Scirpophaga incertulas]